MPEKPMEEQRSPFILKLLPSFTDFAFLMPVALLFGRMSGAKALLGDCDTGWHIRTGEWISANHTVPVRDIFSFSKAGDPWFAWEWLSDVLFAWLNAHGGLRALIVFSVLLISLIFALLFRVLRAKSNPIVAILITVAAAAASSIHWLARPHLFTLLFVVLFCAALEEIKAGRTRLAGIPYLAILPFATILWTNLHGGFFVGILLLLAYGAGEILQIVLRQTGEWLWARRYFVCAAGCLAASLVNPYSYKLHVHLAGYLRNPVGGQFIQEFLSPNFHGPTAVFFEIMLVLAAAAAYWNLTRGRFIEPLLLVMWAHAALLAERNIPIFAIVAAIPVAAALTEGLGELPQWNVANWLHNAVNGFNRLAAATSETEAVGRFHLASVMGLLLVAAVVYAPNPPRNFRAEFDPGRYPAGALATLRQDPLSRIFTDDEWGDYLIWSLYPTHKVFVDGRSDFYGYDFEERYTDIINVNYNWEKILARFGVDTVLLPINAPLAGALKESSRWHLVFDDGVALVFRSAVGRTPRSAAGALVGLSLQQSPRLTNA